MDYAGRSVGGAVSGESVGFNVTCAVVEIFYRSI